MNKQEHILTLLIEECAEVSQICTKILRFGVNSNNNGKAKFTNGERLKQEFNDLIAVAGSVDSMGIDLSIEQDQLDTKLIKIQKYMKQSENLGLLIN